MSSVVFEPDATAEDGDVQRGGANEAWAAIISNAGNLVDYASGNVDMKLTASFVAPDLWTTNTRGIFLFNGATLPPGSILTDVSLSLKVQSLSVANFGAEFVLGNAPVGDPTTLATTDYALLHAAKVEYSDTRHALSSLSAGNRFEFSLNDTGVAAMQTAFDASNVFELGLFFDFDFDESAPTWSSGDEDQVLIYSSEAAAGDGPTLTLTYRVGRGYATIQLTGTLANAGDTVTADMWAVEVFT